MSPHSPESLSTEESAARLTTSSDQSRPGLPDPIGSGLMGKAEGVLGIGQGLCGHGHCIPRVRGKAPGSGVYSKTLWLPSVKTLALNGKVGLG